MLPYEIRYDKMLYCDKLKTVSTTTKKVYMCICDTADDKLIFSLKDHDAFSFCVTINKLYSRKAYLSNYIPFITVIGCVIFGLQIS